MPGPPDQSLKADGTLDMPAMQTLVNEALQVRERLYILFNGCVEVLLDTFSVKYVPAL